MKFNWFKKDPKTSLKLYKETNSFDGYTNVTKMKKFDKMEWLAALLDNLQERSAKGIGQFYKKNYQLIVSTQVSENLWLPVVDIDNEMALTAALYWFELRQIPYETIESSKGHYWLIIAKPMSKQQALLESRIIPGNDKQYAKFIKQHKIITLRAGSLPLPRFLSDGSALKEVGAYQWWLDMQKLYESVEMMFKSCMIVSAINDKDLSKILEDPNWDRKIIGS